jgi:peptide/nickel transport system permease protein
MVGSTREFSIDSRPPTVGEQLARSRRVLRRLRTNRLAFLGLIGIVAIVLVAIFAPVLAPYPPDKMETRDRFLPPGSPAHVLGTDEFGRDVLSRIIYGSRVSLLVSIIAVGVATALGGGIGVLCGYTGGLVDLIVMRVVDVMFAIPALMIALGVVGLFGPSAESVTLALGIAYSPLFARVSRASVVNIRSLGYIEAGQVMGGSHLRILRQDILPNVLPLIIVQMTSSLAWGILDEAAIGFLGLGVQPPTPSWGEMLTTGRQYMFSNPTMPLFAGLAVTLAVYAFNLFGDGLRDLLDPRAWRVNN